MNVVLSVVLGLSVLVDLALATWAGVAWGPSGHGIPTFMKTWLPALLGLTGSSAADARLLGLVLALCLLGFAALQALALRWVLTENEAGHRVAIVFGAWLVLSSVVVFLKFHRPEFLIIDGLRGAALAVLGVLALNAPSTVRELRLPDKPRERRRGDDGMRDDRERRRRDPRDRDDRRPRRDRDGRREPRGRDGRREPRDRDGRRDPRDRDARRERSPDQRRSRDRAPTSHRDLPAERGESPVDAERRGPAEDADRSLKVVIHGAPERIRPAEAAPGTGRDETERGESSESRSRPRRRRRRRPDGDEGRPHRVESRRPAQAGVAPGEPAVDEDRIEESFEEDTGERHDADREGRRRRRRRRPDAEGPFETAPAREPDEASDEPRRGSSPVEALDMLSMLEPVRRHGSTEPFGRGRRVASRRPGPPSRDVPPRPEPGSGPGETRGSTTPPPSVRPDYGREEGSDSEREPD